MSYFVPGAWHFAAAMAFAVAFGVLRDGDALFWLRQPLFLLALVPTSSALFFVPDRWAKRGLFKFLHYPLPDWDVLLLGPASHRHWLTHSALISLLLLGAAWQWPQSPLFQGAMSFVVGLCVGTGSHLFWDCVGSRTHEIVFVPYWWSLRAATSRLYLLAGAALSLGVASAFVWSQK